MNKGNSSVNRLPKFLKVYLPGVSGDDLEIPLSFNRCLPKSLPKNVTIISNYGNIWKTALKRSGGEVERYVLVNGWKSIVKDKDLSQGDFLEFKFDGSRCFNFSIYESRTMCKRLRRCSVQSEDDTSEGFVLDDEGDSEDPDYKCEDDNDDAIPEDDDDDDDDEVVDDRQYLDDINNPFFKVTLNLKNRSQLRIPSKLIKDYSLNFSESVTLTDPLSIKFGTLTKKIKIQTNGCVFIKGYGAILRRNSVRSMDKMICELQKTGNNNLVHTIKFHIITI